VGRGLRGAMKGEAWGKKKKKKERRGTSFREQGKQRERGKKRQKNLNKKEKSSKPPQETKIGGGSLSERVRSL